MSDKKLKFVWSVSFKLLRLCGEAKWLWTVIGPYVREIIHEIYKYWTIEWKNGTGVGVQYEY